MSILYQLSIRFYVAGIRLAALWNSKARFWVAGRRNWEQQLKNLVDPSAHYWWFHAASLGEFEQGRPLIEALKQQYPQIKIALTFFSPSGYEVRKNYPLADLVVYLPADTPRNARRFIRILNPRLVIFIKYEFWMNYLRELQRRAIPHFLVSGIFRPNQIFFRWYGTSYLSVLRGFTHFFVQNERSVRLLAENGITQVTQAGDTRFDRVFANAQQHKLVPLAESFGTGRFLIIGGSTWQPEEELLSRFFQEHMSDDWRLMLAPHDISESHLAAIESMFQEPVVRLSTVAEIVPESVRILIVDSIGKLNALYPYGQVAVVGGGFKTGLHNVLEPAACGLPVVFGPRYAKFSEAIDLIRAGGGQSVGNYEEFKEALMEYYRNISHLEAASRKARGMVKNGLGASEKILLFLKDFI